MAHRMKFVAGNWKMNTNSITATQLAKSLTLELTNSRVRVAVFPPFVYIIYVSQVLEGTLIHYGGQDAYPAQEGPYTGSISPTMLRDLYCRYVLVGHSERRHGLGETDELLNRKLHACLDAELEVIFCIGETLEERQSNQTESVLDRQMTLGLAGFKPELTRKLTIAYEPVWAIGTGVNATPEQAQTAHAFIRRRFGEMFGSDAAEKLIIQYGGSVKPDNAGILMKLPDVDGVLVGGASLDPQAFLAIVKAAL